MVLDRNGYIDVVHNKSDTVHHVYSNVEANRTQKNGGKTMQTTMTVEEIVTEVTLMLSNVFIRKLLEKGSDMLSTSEVRDLYVESLHDTAKAYTHEANNTTQTLN